MTGRIGVLILMATLSLTASWMLGYREGQQTGAFHLLREMNETYPPALQALCAPHSGFQ